MPLQKNDQNNITEVSDVDARPQVNESHILKFNFNINFSLKIKLKYEYYFKIYII